MSNNTNQQTSDDSPIYAKVGSGPDPSILTTRQLMREIESVKDLIDLQQQARVRQQDDHNKWADAQLASLHDLSSEKFKALDIQLELIERQRVEQKSDTKAAVDAALIAQKEAVQEQTIASGLSIAKSEAATAKQLDQMSVTFSTAISGVQKTSSDQKDSFNLSIADLKERLNSIDLKIISIDSKRAGGVEQKQNAIQNLGVVYTIGGLLLMAVTIFATLVAAGAFK